METQVTNRMLMDAEVRAFIQRSVSINVAARLGADVPAVSRAYGCLVDGPELILIVQPQQAAEVLAGVAENGVVAAVFSQPSTHRTIQLKGDDGRTEPLQPGDREEVTAYLNSFRDELRQFGFEDVFMDGLLSGGASEQLLRLRFTPSTAFDQTPGAKAGQALRP